MKWHHSYIAPFFDTDSGKLEVGQYALENGKMLFYHDLNEMYPTSDPDVSGLTLVEIIGTRYVDVFQSDNGAYHEREITKQDYDATLSGERIPIWQ